MLEKQKIWGDIICYGKKEREEECTEKAINLGDITKSVNPTRVPKKKDHPLAECKVEWR